MVVYVNDDNACMKVRYVENSFSFFLFFENLYDISY